LLATIAELRNQKPNLEVLQKDQAYLEKRIPHMQYPQYQAQHLPIGSGAMESGNKVVVEARLKGAGMHWARPHVNPMVALRDIECSNRWSEAWQQLSNALRQQECQRRKNFIASMSKHRQRTFSPTRQKMHCIPSRSYIDTGSPICTERRSLTLLYVWLARPPSSLETFTYWQS